MRRFASGASWTALLVLMCACEPLPARVSQPAILTNPTPQSLAELRRIVSSALNGAPVRLAGDALTHDSVLIVDRVQPRDAAGLPLQGRELGRPEHFQLFMRGSHCVLVQVRTGKRWILTAATCAPAPLSR